MAVPNRVSRWVFGMLGLLGGAWLVLGPSLYPLWNPGDQIQPISTTETTTALLWIGYYYGVGALVIFLSGLAEGLVSGRARVRVPVATSTDAEPVETADEPERTLVVR
jgi:hypothetical protein